MTTLNQPSRQQMTSVSTTRSNPYLERIVRLVAIGVSIAITIFAIIVVIRIVAVNNDSLETEHANALNRLDSELDERLERYTTDLLSIRNDQSLLDHLTGTPNVEAASNRAGEIIALHLNEYQRIQFISLENDVPTVAFAREGSSPNTVLLGNNEVYEPHPAASDAFTTVITSNNRNAVLSNFYTLTDEDGAIDPAAPILMEAYIPVAVGGETVMVINIQIDTRLLRNTVNLAIGDTVDAQEDRRVMLIVNGTDIVADSGATGRAYLENLNVGASNFLTNDFYRSLQTYEDFASGEGSQDVVRDFVSATIYSSAAVEFDLIQNLNWHIAIVDNAIAYYAGAAIGSTFTGLLALVLAVAIVLVTKRILSPILQPIYEADSLVQTAVLDNRVAVPSVGNQGDFVRAARRISTRLDRLNNDLERTAAKRNRDMQVAGRIGRETATLSDLDALANRAINLICNELGFYHAQIFLLDESGTNAVLRYSRGEAGEALIEQGHQLRVGSDTVIGTVTAEKRPVIVNDTQRGARDPHRANPLLQETRAEMGLPLLIGDNVIGTLDIQSRQADVFEEDDIPIYQLLADQLAVGIYNAQLRAQTDQRIQQINTLNRQLTRDSWVETEEKLELKQEYGAAIDDAQLAAEIVIRGEVIGSIEADLPEGEAFSEGDRQILQSVAERVSVALENARLFQETQVSLQETSALYSVSRQLNEANDLEDILEAIIESVADNASGGQVWLFDAVRAGDRPDWSRVVVDLEIQERESNMSLLGRRVQLSTYPFLDNFIPDDIYLLEDIRNVGNLPDDIEQFFLNINAISVIFMPLNTRGEWRGFMSITFADPIRLNEQERRFYRSLIAQAGVAIENRLLLIQTEDALARQERLYAASRYINTSQSLADLVRGVVATSSAQHLDFWLAMLTGERDDEGWATQAHIVAKSKNREVVEVDEYHQLFIPEQSPMRRREPEILVDPGEEFEDVPGPVKSMREQGFRFMAIFPLFSNNDPIALFYIVNEQPFELSQEDYEVYRALTGQMSIQIQNRNLLTRTESALRETESLFNANTAISRATDIDDLFNNVKRLIKEVMSPDMMAGFLTRDDKTLEMFRIGFDSEEGHEIDLDELMDMPLPLREGIYISDLQQNAIDAFELDIIRFGNISAFAAINLAVQGAPIGRILIAYEQPYDFKESDKRYLSAIADSASVVIDNQLLIDRVRESLDETNVLYQASKALIEIDEPEEIVDTIVDQLIGAHINQVFIAMLNIPDWESPDAVVQIAASWQQDGDLDLQGVSLSPEQFPAWKQMSTYNVLLIDDIYDEKYDLDPLEQVSIESLSTRSLVVMPLRVPGRPIGAIWLSSDQTHEYTDRDLRIFQSFAEQTSLALEAKRLVEQTERRATQLQTSAVISQSIGQILDLDILLPQVVDLIREQFNYDHVQIFLMDDDNEWANLTASTGEAGVKLLDINHRLKRGSASVIGRVTEIGEPTIALDTADADVIHKPNPFLPLTRSEMALPMVVQGRIVGALDVQSNQPRAFSDDDVQVLETLASQIAVAIDNARLYEEAEQSAEDMAFLFEVTTAAAASDTLDDALAYIARQIRPSLRSDVVGVYLQEIYEDYYGNQKQILELAASDSGEDIFLQQTASVEVGDSENLVGIVASGLQPQIIANVQREVRYVPLIDNAQSAVVVPISSGSNLIGTIILESTRANAFANDDLNLIQALTGSLAAVIQNTLLVERLQETNEQLREVDRLKSQFLASMSHELRTPLNSIIGFSRVMLKGIDGPLTEMQEQDLTTIYNSGNHLLRLINDILDQAKIEADELNLKFGYFEIKPLVESVKSMAIGLLKEKPELDFHVEVAEGLPKAYGDEFRSRQILLNLVTNAIKFTQEGEVRIRVYAIEGDPAPMIRLDVADSGIGISEQDLPTVFEQFRQVDSSLTRTVGGTGLGLPISKSLAELQGGDLTVESEVNVGSVFSVNIPTYEGAEEELERRQSANRAAQKPVNPQDKLATASGLISRADVEAAKKQAGILDNISSNGKSKSETQEVEAISEDANKPSRIDTNVTQAIPLVTQKRDVILVEDDKTMVDQFRRILQREGFEVTTADFPSFAEAMIGQLRPRVVILDVNFADGKGWELLENLKERDDTFDIPVVVTTIDEDSERAYRLGAHTFIQRPFLPDDILEAVLKAEKESQRERIVIIDDQPDAIRLLTQLLEEHSDFKIYSAQSGDEGISLVARRRPDLIILDLRMPGKDGFAVLDELRGNPETANIPVLVVTGEIDLNNEEQEQLVDIHMLRKSDISKEEYDLFIENVRSYLESNNGTSR